MNRPLLYYIKTIMELVTCLPYTSSIHGESPMNGQFIVEYTWTAEEFYSGKMQRYAARHNLRMEIARVIDGYYVTCTPTTFWLRIFQRRIRRLQLEN